MRGPQQKRTPSEAAPVTVQVRMDYFYRVRREKVWVGKGLGSSRAEVGVGRMEQKDKREKLKLKQAGAKLDVRKNFPSMQPHHEFSRCRKNFTKILFSRESVPHASSVDIQQ